MTLNWDIIDRRVLVNSTSNCIQDNVKIDVKIQYSVSARYKFTATR